MLFPRRVFLFVLIYGYTIPMDILEKIFGSNAKVRMMRLFLFNPGTPYDIKDISFRTNTNQSVATKEVNNLKATGLIQNKIFTKEISKRNGKKLSFIKKKSKGWVLNQKFEYLEPLVNFLLYMNPFRGGELVKKLRRTGSIKFLAVSGVFLQEWDSRVDLLIVGNINKNVLENVIRSIEAEIGKELKYTALTTEDFLYRIDMCDKLVSDVLEHPHEKLVNHLGIQ